MLSELVYKNSVLQNKVFFCFTKIETHINAKHSIMIRAGFAYGAECAPHTGAGNDKT